MHDRLFKIHINESYLCTNLDGVKTNKRSLSNSPKISWSAIGLSILEVSFLHLGTNTVISLCPLDLNQSTQILIPLQENISLFPWLIATLLPSITTDLRLHPLFSVVAKSESTTLSDSSEVSTDFWEQLAPNFINSAKSSFCSGSGPNFSSAVWTKRSV